MDKANLAEAVNGHIDNKVITPKVLRQWGDKVGAVSVVGKASKNLFDGIIENGRYGYSTGAKITNDSNRRNKYPIKVEPSTTYIFSNNGSGVGMNIMFYDKNYNYLYYETMDAGVPFTTSSKSYYVNFFRGSSSCDAIQLEKGSTITPYEEYYEPKISIRDSNGVFQEVNLDYEDLSSTITPGENITINYVEVRKFGKVVSIVASITPTASIEPYAIILNGFPNHNRSAYTIACNVTDNATAGGVYLYANMLQTRASMASGKNYRFTLTYIVD